MTLSWHSHVFGEIICVRFRPLKSCCFCRRRRPPVPAVVVYLFGRLKDLTVHFWRRVKPTGFAEGAHWLTGRKTPIYLLTCWSWHRFVCLGRPWTQYPVRTSVNEIFWFVQSTSRGLFPRFMPTIRECIFRSLCTYFLFGLYSETELRIIFFSWLFPYRYFANGRSRKIWVKAITCAARATNTHTHTHTRTHTHTHTNNTKLWRRFTSLPRTHSRCHPS